MSTTGSEISRAARALTVSAALAFGAFVQPAMAAPAARDTSAEISPIEAVRGVKAEFQLKHGDLENLTRARGGEKKTRKALSLAMIDARGGVVDTRVEIVKLRRGTITFRWTPPPDIETGLYGVEIRLDGVLVDAWLKERIAIRSAKDGSGDALDLRAEIERALRGLFESYRREDGYNFVRQLHPGFFGTADNNVALTYSTIRISIEDDFRNFDEIFFDWSINSIREYEQGSIVEAEVTWNQRYKDAVGANAGVETRRLSKVTKFIFRREDGALKLSTWQGAAAFGLAAPGGVGASR